MNNALVVTHTGNGEISAVKFIPFGSTEQIELTIATVKKFLTSPTKSGKQPDDKDVVKYMMLCQARALNPWEGDAVLVGYDGREGAVFSMITTHQAFLKRAEGSPEYDGMQSGIIVRKGSEDDKEIEGEIVPPGYILVGGWARVHRKDRKYPMYKKLDLKGFEKSFGLWAGSQKVNMIVKCAEADGLRSSFPNKLGNLYIEGERVPVEIVEQSEEKTKPEASPKPQAAGLKDTLKNRATIAPPTAITSPKEKHSDVAPAVVTNNDDAPEQADDELQPENNAVAIANAESEAINVAPPYPESWREDRKQIPKGASLAWEKHTPLMLKAKANTPEFRDQSFYEARYKLIEVYDKPLVSDDKLFDELSKVSKEAANAAIKK